MVLSCSSGDTDEAVAYMGLDLRERTGDSTAYKVTGLEVVIEELDVNESA